MSQTIEGALVSGRVVRVRYKNHRGVTAVRRVEPQRIWFGSTDWHSTPQWLLDVFDVDRGALRTFAMQDIGEFVG